MFENSKFAAKAHLTSFSVTGSEEEKAFNIGKKRRKPRIDISAIDFMFTFNIIIHLEQYFCSPDEFKFNIPSLLAQFLFSPNSATLQGNISILSC